MRRTLLTLTCACLLLSACEDPLYLMQEEYLLEGDDEVYIGGSCQEVSDGLTAGTGAGGDGRDYAVTTVGSDDGVTVTVTGEMGETLEERTYDERFLSSGESDSFVVRSEGVEFLRLKFWGGATCEPPRDPPAVE